MRSPAIPRPISSAGCGIAASTENNSPASDAVRVSGPRWSSAHESGTTPDVGTVP